MILTVPNLISMLRIAAVPFFVWLLLGADDPVAAAWVLGSIAWTDWVDGWVARRFDQVSELGKILDPAADRLTVGAAIVAGWISGHLPWPIALAIAVRETLVVTGVLFLAARTGIRLDVRYLGKVATFGVYFALPFFLFHSGTGWAWHAWVAWGVGVPSLVLYYAVAVEYALEARQVLQGGEPVSSERPATPGDAA